MSMLAGAFAHDVAILELSRDVWKSDTTRPACLPQLSEASPPEGTRCVVYGWGVDAGKRLVFGAMGIFNGKG